MVVSAVSRRWRSFAAYCRSQYLELPATILEGITLVLLVFVQDVAFKESVAVCAGLLFLSLVLHGLAYRAGQCQVWPKVIELAAPWPFVAMLPPAHLATSMTQKTAFITINLWFAAVEVICMLAGRNFMMDYMQDWNPKEVWGTPLLQRSAAVTAAVWIVCQVIMAVSQILAVVFNLSVDSGRNVGAAVFVCYVMQLIPLLAAVVNTFAYPAWLKKRWGYVEGVRSTCYPPPNSSSSSSLKPAHSMASASEGSSVAMLSGCGRTSSGVGLASGSANSGSQQSIESSKSGVSSEDVVVCISPQGSTGGSKQTGGRPVAGGQAGGSSSSSSSGSGSRSSSADGVSGNGGGSEQQEQQLAMVRQPPQQQQPQQQGQSPVRR